MIKFLNETIEPECNWSNMAWMQQDVVQIEPTELQLHVQKFINVSKSILVDPTPKIFKLQPTRICFKIWNKSRTLPIHAVTCHNFIQLHQLFDPRKRPTIKCVFKPSHVFIKLVLQRDNSKLKLETSPTQVCTVKPIYLRLLQVSAFF